MKPLFVIAMLIFTACSTRIKNRLIESRDRLHHKTEDAVIEEIDHIEKEVDKCLDDRSNCIK